MDFEIRIGKWVEELVTFMLDHFQPTFDAIATVVNGFGGAIDFVLVGAPAWLLIGLIVATSLWRVGTGFAVFTVAALSLIAGMGLWTETASTLGLVLTATLLSLLIGVPLGVWMARNRVVESIVRTTLDFMQTMPAFVYLIPAVMFFGLGRVPGILATVIFAMPPAVRLTSLGIQQVPAEIVEAGKAFGCHDRQLLFKVQLPNALPSIMAGVNQTMMMALSMIVIASMIGAGGLGNVVLQGIQRLDIALGFESGLSVVLLAIILDRITQSFGQTAAAPRPVRFAFLRRFLPVPAR
ncbi:proline/glycine betaine ABC transporter permease [Azospirillum sp. A26]|uniref:ABC transporter permease n=1 Tax=Azospirillum sp. A26 TaxID=3160607 RepID=UPI003672AAD7